MFIHKTQVSFSERYRVSYMAQIFAARPRRVRCAPAASSLRTCGVFAALPRRDRYTPALKTLAIHQCDKALRNVNTA